ncbi:glycosyltransferase [Pseudonocardia sp. MH-G8]|uniref:glycosyltransferase n=1 Tax=Pseudonocardia sp. MH-G8 TaxID=1854588 RepID=UPI00117BB311|nr:glycosyltransferase [Pseudonocardia sp. MH-G8]
MAPATGLGAAFVADGHRVTIVANSEYEALVTGAGCSIAPITAPITPPSGTVGARGVRAHLATLRTYMDQAATAALAAAVGAEAVLTNAISPYGHDIAEHLGVPSAEALLQPSQPSAAYPPMIASGTDLGRVGNRMAGHLAQQVRTPYDPARQRVRSELGLPPESRRAAQRRRRSQGLPIHHGISPAVLPRPDDWPAELTLDGFWWPHEPDDWAPPPSLLEFLDAGPAPVVVTLGSIPTSSATARAVADALTATKARAVLQGEDLRQVAEHLGSPDILHVGEVPHSWLLPRAAVVVHQAGAGITSATLRAGIPSVTLPVHTDQPFWARRLVALDAGTEPIPAKDADGGRLAAAITTALSSRQLRDGAHAVRDALRGENSTLPLQSWLRRLAVTS